MSDSLKQRIQADMKSAMKNKEKERLLTIRTILAAIKQIEVDERIELDDTRVLAVLDKMVKQRPSQSSSTLKQGVMNWLPLSRQRSSSSRAIFLRRLVRTQSIRSLRMPLLKVVPRP